MSSASYIQIPTLHRAAWRTVTFHPWGTWDAHKTEEANWNTHSWGLGSDSMEQAPPKLREAAALTGERGLPWGTACRWRTELRNTAFIELPHTGMVFSVLPLPSSTHVPVSSSSHQYTLAWNCLWLVPFWGWIDVFRLSQKMSHNIRHLNKGRLQFQLFLEEFQEMTLCSYSLWVNFRRGLYQSSGKQIKTIG